MTVWVLQTFGNPPDVPQKPLIAIHADWFAHLSSLQEVVGRLVASHEVSSVHDSRTNHCKTLQTLHQDDTSFLSDQSQLNLIAAAIPSTTPTTHLFGHTHLPSYRTHLPRCFHHTRYVTSCTSDPIDLSHGHDCSAGITPASAPSVSIILLFDLTHRL